MLDSKVLMNDRKNIATSTPAMIFVIKALSLMIRHCTTS